MPKRAKLYAEGTEVSLDSSLAEIQGIVKKYGGVDYMSGHAEGRGSFFSWRQPDVNRVVRFNIHWPTEADLGVATTPGGTKRSKSELPAAQEAEFRRRARALVIRIKSLLEVVYQGGEMFEEVFLAKILLPDGSTVAEQVAPRIALAYESGQMPPDMLPGLPPPGDT